MLKLILTFLAWASVGTLAYYFISPLAMVIYAVASMMGFLIWAATRKK